MLERSEERESSSSGEVANSLPCRDVNDYNAGSVQPPKPPVPADESSTKSER